MPHEARLKSWLVLLLRTISVFVVLKEWVSVTTKGQGDVPGLGCHLANDGFACCLVIMGELAQRV